MYRPLIVIMIFLACIIVAEPTYSQTALDRTILIMGRVVENTLDVKRYIYWDGSWSLNDFATYSDGMQAHYDAVKGYSIFSVRPNYTTFLYRNVRDCHSAYDSVYNASGTLELDYFRSNGWLLKDSSGNEVTDPYYAGNHYCDIGNASYQQYLADWYYYYIQLNHYPAAFLDNGMCSSASSWSWGASPAPPINPRTGIAWTDNDVINAYTTMYSVLKQKLVGLNTTIVANSVGTSTGYKYFHFSNYRSRTITMSQQIDGFMCEQWLSAENMAYFPEADVGNYNWKDSIDMLVDFENQFSGKNIILVAVAPEYPDYGLTTLAQKQQYCTFAYVSMLLGIGTRNTYWLTLGLWGLKNMQSLYSTNIGEPTGSYYVDSNGLYVRQFTRGTVYLNPSSSTRGTLPAHTALIT